ncbi:AraC family transcriptional regulator [Hyphobacterium sp. CCMP332]|uniref:AraC family transcriptional regulator n=1 Tax=Hyphobacterium sp. CCMP332 TaxID=2749086 RepID=UPI00164FA0BC|nr:AraC family transcriptional regulator [Hyphobacterium sp. CCMP332]QNL18145.1 AraC family transcriptional regulator [Hyphobacterium sp. CCMP332]
MRKIMDEGLIPTSASDRYIPPARVDIRVRNRAYAPHRHDTYVFALTCAGIQCFDYRGEMRVSHPGELVVLHPDEKHDGRAGTEAGFHYRGISIDPAALQLALNGRVLPFIEGGVTRDERLIDVIAPLLSDMAAPLTAAEFEAALADLAEAMLAASGAAGSASIADAAAAHMARHFIIETPDRTISLDELEALTGQNRWQLSRDFRALFGTSPYRFGQLRRLDRARAMLREPGSLADTAYATGFADQSHLTRDFKKAFGITPKAWQALVH